MPRLLRLLPLSAVLLALLAGTFGTASAHADAPTGWNKQPCAHLGLPDIPAFEAMVGRSVDCVLVYNDAAPDWSSWERPWFLYTNAPGLDHKTWSAAVPGRKLVITQNLFPSSVNTTNWREAAAQGAFDDHARNLARNLVAAGQGSAVIRLAHEANGDWYPDSIGNSPADYARWVQFWRRTVLAMRSVPGAHFSFDWSVNAGYRNIPLASYYPGDDVVDIVGIDAYDAASTLPAGAARWNWIYTRSGGLRDAVTFAKAHGKPLSIPEWGVAPTSVSVSGGDDPTYIDGIAQVVRDNDVAYQSYFYAHDWATQLADGPGSLAAYRAHFGANGDALAPAGTTVATPVRDAPSSPAPVVAAVTAPVAAAQPAARTKTTTPAPLATHAPAPVPSPAASVARSKAVAQALAASTALGLRKTSGVGRRTITIAAPKGAAGVACIAIVPLHERATTLGCGTQLVRLRGTGSPRAVTSAATRVQRMKRTTVSARAIRLSVPAGFRPTDSQRIVVVFAPSGGPADFAIASSILPRRARD